MKPDEADFWLRLGALQAAINHNRGLTAAIAVDRARVKGRKIMRITNEYHFDRTVKVIYTRLNGEVVEDYADGTVSVSLIETDAEARRIAREQGWLTEDGKFKWEEGL